jgi:hypothetical protein
MLKSVETQLAQHLDEACSHDGDGIEEESTSELMKLEESLVDAAQAAKQAVSLRRRLRTGHGAPGAKQPPAADRETTRQADAGDQRGESGGTWREPDRSSGGEEGGAVREFRDRLGVIWRVWAVTPERLHPESILSGKLGEYADGWLAFENADGTQHRRLPHFPDNWAGQSNDALETLLQSAEMVRKRRKGGADDTESSHA